MTEKKLKQLRNRETNVQMTYDKAIAENLVLNREMKEYLRKANMCQISINANNITIKGCHEYVKGTDHEGYL